MVKRRGPVDVNRDDEIERFAAAAETTEPAEVAPASPPLEPWKRRARSGAKAKGYNFRFNSAQHALLNYAAEAEDLSQQKVIEDLVWPVLEERYGKHFPLR